MGYKLAAWPRRDGKAPQKPGWGLAAIDPAEVTADLNIGCNHALSGTASLDADDLDRTRVVLEFFGLDIETLKAGTMAWVGRPGRMKLMFRALSPAMPVKKLRVRLQAGADPVTVMELRGAEDGKQAQDVLPPSVHPDTGEPYRLLTEPIPVDRLPPLPDALADLWRNWSSYEPALRRVLGDVELSEVPHPGALNRSGADVIGAFNARHSVGEVIARNGYEKRGSRRWLRPGSTTGVAGVVLLPTGNAVYCHGGGSLDDNKPHDAFDCFRVLEHRGDMRAAVKAAAREFGMSAPSWGNRLNGEADRAPAESIEPVPLMKDVPPAAPFPLWALGPILAPAAKAIAEHVQVSPALAGNSVLAAAALAVQPHADVMTLGGVRPTSLYVLTIAASGDRKSSADAIATAPGRAHERTLEKRWTDEYAEYCAALEAYREALKGAKASAAGNPDELRRTLLKLSRDEPQEPRRPWLLLRDPTIQGIAKSLRAGQLAQGLFNDEAGTVLGGYSMTEEARLHTLAGYNDFWNAAPINRVRSTDDEHGTLRGRRVSMHLLAQPEAAAGLFSESIYRGTGFLARCLIAAPESLAGSRMHSGTLAQPESDPRVRAYMDALGRLFALAPPEDEEGGGLMPKALRLEGHALTTICDEYNRIEAAQAQAGDLAEDSEFASKAAEHACRIAGVLTMIENDYAVAIEPDAMAHAVELVRFYLCEQVRLRAASIGDQATRDAQRLLGWIAKRVQRGEAAFTRRDAMRLGPNSIRDTKSN